MPSGVGVVDDFGWCLVHWLIVSGHQICTLVVVCVLCIGLAELCSRFIALVYWQVVSVYQICRLVFVCLAVCAC